MAAYLLEEIKAIDLPTLKGKFLRREFTLSFLHDDRLGTPQLATDSGQNIAWQNTYVPFGSTGSIGGTITQDLRLPGQVFDPIGGEYLNGFRDYLPLIGRYIEPDPLGRLGSGNNLYAYANDNPVSFDDPFGLASPQYPTWIEIYTGILSNGGFIYYGNWGGPGWTGGQETPYEDLSPSDQANLAPSIDAQDPCYEQHDKCYSRSRVANNGTSSTIGQQCAKQKLAEQDAQRGCDAELMMCLQNVNASGGPGDNWFSKIAQPVFSIKEMWP